MIFQAAAMVAVCLLFAACQDKRFVDPGYQRFVLVPNPPPGEWSYYALDTKTGRMCRVTMPGNEDLALKDSCYDLYRRGQ